jgi:hypothetical protein
VSNEGLSTGNQLTGPERARDGIPLQYIHVMGALATLVLSQVCFVQASDFVEIERFVGGSREQVILIFCL